MGRRRETATHLNDVLEGYMQGGGSLDRMIGAVTNRPSYARRWGLRMHTMDYFPDVVKNVASLLEGQE